MLILTGGAGFIGSCFLARLNEAGMEDILVVDNLRSGEKWKNLRGKRFLDYIHKDRFLQQLETQGIPRETTAVIHLGACSSTTESNAEYMLSNNFQYSKKLAQAALGAGVRFIYASSAATYGDGDRGFADDVSSLNTLVPLNVYAYSKHLFDLWASKNGLLDKLCGVKFFNVFGPNEYHKAEMRSLVFKAVGQIRDSGRLKLFKSYRSEFADGEQKRDFVYIKDCNEVLLWMLENPQVNGLFNLGSGGARSWNELATAVFSALNKEAAIDYIDMPDELKGKYQYFTEAPMSKLRAAGYQKPLTTLEASVKDYVEAYLGEELSYL